MRFLKSALVAVSFWSVAARPCEPLLGTPFVRAEMDEIFVRCPDRWDFGCVHVTGERQFPLDVVLRALAVENEPWPERTVLSVGEGWSSLAAHARRRGAYALATDTWYGAPAFPCTASGRELARFVDAHRAHLVAARCARLPFRGGAFDLVLSNLLLHHVRVDQDFGEPDADAPAVRFLAEIARVLRPGGRAVLTQFLFEDEDRAGLESHLELAFDRSAVAWSVVAEDLETTNLRSGLPQNTPILRVTLTKLR